MVRRASRVVISLSVCGLVFAACGGDNTVQINAGVIAPGLEAAHTFNVSEGARGGVYGKLVGTGEPVCFVVDANLASRIEVAATSKWTKPTTDEPLGTFSESSCADASNGSAPAFCWVRTLAGTEYTFIVSRFANSATRATVAAVPGPCPKVVDEAVFPYDGETGGDATFHNQEVRQITLDEGLDKAATFAFDAAGANVTSGFSANFTSPGGPVCFVIDSSLSSKIEVGLKGSLKTQPDGARVGEFQEGKVACWNSTTTSSPTFCQVTTSAVNDSFQILATVYNDASHNDTLVAVKGACPRTVDEAVFPFDGETDGSARFANHEVVNTTLAATGAAAALKAALDPAGAGVDRGVSAKFVATAAGAACFVVDCDVDCKIEAATDSAANTPATDVSVGAVTASTRLCESPANVGVAGAPAFCLATLTSGTTYRIVATDYLGSTPVRMAVAVLASDCAGVTEDLLTYDTTGL